MPAQRRRQYLQALGIDAWKLRAAAAPAAAADAPAPLQYPQPPAGGSGSALRAAEPALAAAPPPAIDLPGDWQGLRAMVKDCTRCKLCSTRTQTVFGVGVENAPLMVVGEGPGADEDAQGLPFVGKAGQLLDRMIVAMGYQPDDVYIANIVKCRPPNNRKPEPSEMAACVGYLHEQIALVRPKAIVALGATACEGLLGMAGITRLRGTWRLYRGEIPVMPTFHPAYLLRKPEDKRLVWADLQQVMSRLGKSPAKR